MKNRKESQKGQGTTKKTSHSDSSKKGSEEESKGVNEADFATTSHTGRDQTLMPSGQPDQPREGDPMETGRR